MESEAAVSVETAPEEVVGTDDGDQDLDSKTQQPSEDLPVKTEESGTESAKKDGDGDKVEKIKSRELKSLIAAAKESNLDTNIVHKRKSLQPEAVVHQDNKDHVYTTMMTSSPTSPAVSLNGSLMKRNMRSQNPEFVAKHHKFISKCITNENIVDLNREDGIVEARGDDVVARKALKRKRDSNCSTMSNTSFTSGASPMMEERKSRKLLKLETPYLIKPGQDLYCWQCHKDGIQIQCVGCPRSYHLRCLRHAMPVCENWTCTECMVQMQADLIEARSPARQRLTDEQFTQVLKFALKRMINVTGAEPFMKAVDVNELDDYMQYVVHPMHLDQLKQNIDAGQYKSTESFVADTKWILHNSMIYNSSQSKLTTIAKSIVKTCKIEMAEIETCPECYMNANTQKDTWFLEVCSKPHILVWAKLKGFPFWPAKAVNTNETTGMVDVRFFGQHDKAWVPTKDVYLYSIKDPNTLNKHQKNNIAESLKEVELHIDKLVRRFGVFVPAPLRTPFEPHNESKQIKMLLPNYEQPSSLFRSTHAGQTKQKKTIDNGGNTVRRRLKPQVMVEDESAHDKMLLTPSAGYGTEEDDEEEEDDEDEDDDDDDVKADADDDEEEEEEEASRRSSNDNDNESENDDDTTSNIKKTPSSDHVRTPTSSLKVMLLSGRKRKSTGSQMYSRGGRRRDSDVSSTKSYKSDVSSSVSSLNKVELFDVANVQTSSTEDVVKSGGDAAAVNKLKSTVVQVNPVELISTNAEIQLTTKQATSDATSIIQTMADKIMKKITNNDDICKQETKQPPPAAASIDDHNDDEHADGEGGEEGVDADVDDTSQTEQAADSDYEPDETEEDDDESDADTLVSEDKSRMLTTKTKTRHTAAADVDDDKKVTLVDVKKIILGNENQSKIVADADSDDKKSTVKNIKGGGKDGGDNKDPRTLATATATNKDDKMASIEQLDPNIDIKEEVLDDTDDDDGPASLPPVPPAAGEAATRQHEYYHQELLPTLNLSPNVTVSKIKKLNNNVNNRGGGGNNNALTSSARCVVNNDNVNSKFNKLKNVNNYLIFDDRNIKSISSLIQHQVKHSTSTPPPDDNVIKTIENVVKGGGEASATTVPPGGVLAHKRPAELKVISVAEINQKKLLTSSSTSPASATSSTSTSTSILNNSNNYSHVKQKARKSFPNKSATLISMGGANSIKSNKMGGKHEQQQQQQRSMMVTTSTTNKVIAIDNKTTFDLHNKDKMVYIPSTTTTTSVNGVTSVTLYPQPPGAALTSAAVPPGATFNTTKFLVPQNIFTSLSHQSNNSGGILVGNITKCGSGGVCSTTTSLPLISSVTTLTPSPTKAILLSAASAITTDEEQRNNAEGLPPLRPRPKLVGASNGGEASTTSSSMVVGGPVTQLLNRSSQQLTDYFRGVIVETLGDLSNLGSLEAKVKQLQIELEQLKHKHHEEITSYKYEIATLKQQHLTEKQRVVHETRQACEQDRLRAVDEAKSKQWCAMCLKESQYRCCWSTSYCSYVCQRNHWPTHQTKCQQNVEKQQQQQQQHYNHNNLIMNGTDDTIGGGASIIQHNTTNNTMMKSIKMNNNVFTGANQSNITKHKHGISTKNLTGKSNGTAGGGKINLITSSKSNGSGMNTTTTTTSSSSSSNASTVSPATPTPAAATAAGVPTLTFVQNSSGGIELVNHGPIALGGKLIPSAQFTSKIKGYLIQSHTSNSNTSNTTALITPTTSLQQQQQGTHKITTTNSNGSNSPAATTSMDMIAVVDTKK